jgi:hypothetical protein
MSYSLFATRHFATPGVVALTVSQSNIATTPEAALFELERRALRALSSENAEPGAREIARRALTDYRWRQPVHQAVFDVIMSFPSASNKALREQLPGRLTRRGFPDFDFESLFESREPEPGELEQLITKLRGSRVS